MNKLKVIAFDADDTLWDCQSHFEAVEQQLYDLIAPYCDDPAHELFLTESANMADLGYGCKAFTISIIETALHVAGNSVTHQQLADLLDACKLLLHLPATPLPGVEKTLALLRQSGDATPLMVCFTKGELQDQENKLRRSGLERYFDDVMITSDKTQHEFHMLCHRYNIHPSELLMVGNSLKSDIAPALAIGAWAIHIPFHVTWQLEQVDDFDHERMFAVNTFADIPAVLHTNNFIL